MIYAREFRAKKARFGWDCGALSLKNVVDFGKFYEELKTKFAPHEYHIEETGWNPSTSVKIYTDSDSVADWVRSHSSQTHGLTI